VSGSSVSSTRSATFARAREKALTYLTRRDIPAGLPAKGELFTVKSTRGWALYLDAEHPFAVLWVRDGLADLHAVRPAKATMSPADASSTRCAQAVEGVELHHLSFLGALLGTRPGSP
jgi:hypothetical protein